MDMMTNEIMSFESQFGQLEITSIDGKEYFAANEVAIALGYSNPQKAIRDHCKEKGCTFRSVSSVTGEKQKRFIDEGNVYRLIARSKLPSAEQFEEWIFEEVLPQIRRNGAYISPNITFEQENLLDKFGTPKKLKTTINIVPIEHLNPLLNEYLAYKKPKTAHDKLLLMNQFNRAVDFRIEASKAAGMIGSAHDLLAFSRDLVSRKVKINNKKHGGIKANLRKINRKLSQQVEDLNDQNRQLLIEHIELPEPEIEYHTLNVHGFSNNFMFERVGAKIFKTNAYKKWIDNFPYQEMPNLNLTNEQEYELFIDFDCKASIDVHNLTKSAIDIIANYYEVNDRFITKVHVNRRSIVDDYKDGKIHFSIVELE
jgi:prophage antirepressor-like protein